MNSRVSNVNIKSITPLHPPSEVLAEIPASPQIEDLVVNTRQQIADIITGKDDRLLVISGPCSIHDRRAGLEYAQRLLQLSTELDDRIMILMRAYFEKPRTTVGWKGLINDPKLDGSYNIPSGLRQARQFLLEVTEIGMPTATEFLGPFVPQYVSDVVSWGAIGARTAESQTHRQMASGLSMPVGFKNGTGGSIQLAIDGVVAAEAAHAFLGIDDSGNAAVFQTTGNPACHIVLRGGSSGPNYSAEHVQKAQDMLKANGLSPNLVIDCSHANCDKDHVKEPIAFRDVLQQRVDGNKGIVGVMLESHLNAGKQSMNGGVESLQYGVSITDPCIGWNTTEELLREAHAALAPATVSV